MVLQTSGNISFNDIKTEFNGIKPIRLSEYRGDSSTKYTLGAFNIPLLIDKKISISNFYGKERIVSIPAKVKASLTGIYTKLSNSNTATYYLYITGASAYNKSRYGLSGFNNIGALGNNRVAQIDYTNFCIQAKKGDTLEISVNIGSSFENILVRPIIMINNGAGWYINIIYNETYTHQYAGNTTTTTFNYVIPNNISLGTSVLLVMADINGTTTRRTENYYTLHIF
jgi:hypothetical protein